MRPRKFVRSTALMLVLTAALTVTAFAADPTQQPATKTDNKSSYYPTSVEMTEDDAGNPMIRKTYQLSVSDDPQKLPVADFERDGRRYYLLDMTKEDKIGVDTKEHSETVKLSSDTKEMEQILQRLDAQKEVTTEDGHTGVLTLDHTSVKVTADGYGTKKHTLPATRTYPNLSDADVALIPKTIQDNGHTLTLADVQWDSAYQTEADEAVVRYCATAQYTGESSSQYVTGYTVTADYSGRVTKIKIPRPMAGGHKKAKSVFAGTAWLRSCRFLFHQLVHGDKSHKVIGNADVLPPFAAALVRRFNVDRLHKLPQRVRGQLL